MGSKWLCLDCGEVYNSEYLNVDYPKTGDRREVWCPKALCVGKMFEIDELMIPTIKMLNKKGYWTRYCCSGHYYGANNGHTLTYINFKPGISLPSIPNGFRYMEENDDIIKQTGITIESVDFVIQKPHKQEPIEEKPTSEDFYHLLDRIKVLTEWAEGLPPFKKEDEGTKCIADKLAERSD